MSDTEDPTQTKLKLVELLSASMTGSVWKIDAYIMLVMAIPKFSIPIALPPGKVDRRLGRNREEEKKKRKRRRQKKKEEPKIRKKAEGAQVQEQPGQETQSPSSKGFKVSEHFRCRLSIHKT